MTLKDDAKFKEKVTCGLKNDVRDMLNFHGSIWKSGNLHFDELLFFKVYKDLYLEELCLMRLESDAKFEEKTDS